MALYIQELKVSAGYLEDSPVRFHNQLTCIIGARGTCKSTIVETIRYAFNCDPSRVELLLQDSSNKDQPQDGPSSKGLIRATLEGGAALVQAYDNQAGQRSELSVERSGNEPPRVFRDGVKELADPTSVLTCVEIYSQGDLQRIAEDGSKRLDLIDQPNRQRVEALKSERRQLADELSSLGPQIRQLRNDIEDLKGQVKHLEGYRAELAQIQKERPELSQEMSTEREAFQRREAILQRARQIVARREEVIAELQPFIDEAPSFIQSAQELETTDTLETQSLAQLVRSFADALASMGDAMIVGAQPDPDSLLSDLATRFENQSKPYYELLQKEEQVTESLKQEDGIKRQIQHLTAAETQLAGLFDKHQSLVTQRQKLRQRIELISDTLYQLRIEQVEQINATFGNVVLLTLHQGTRSKAYQDLVGQLLRGSRLHNQDDVSADLAERVRPCDLVDIVESGDSNRLAEVLGRDLGQMARLVAFLIDNASLYQVETAIFDDWLEITMFVDGVPKPLSQLSKGQMATALLPLILRPADYPLMFDQPEDDLDNRFIYETLIKQISALKQKRQLVFVTHNANIPVLGEADHIVVMSMKSPSRAAAPLEGDVESAKEPILAILEGGAEAFRLRQRKYGPLLATQGNAHDGPTTPES